jgi:mono/diheme cytochrome c family protein
VGRVVPSLLAVLAFCATATAQGPALNFLQYCAGCHRTDGAGSERNNVPDMRGIIGHFARLAEGRAFLIQVAGVAQAPLPASDVATLMNWLLPEMSRAELPDDFAPYSAAEVADLRRTRPADMPAIRTRLVAELATLGHMIPD